MGETPLTRPSLLLRVRDPLDHEAWRQFIDLYAPLVYQFGRRRGLQDADAADLAQTAFASLTRVIRRRRVIRHRLEIGLARGYHSLKLNGGASHAQRSRSGTNRVWRVDSIRR